MSDEVVIELLKKELIKLEKDNLSYIVIGFPKNRVQSMFLQSVGILPDNVIMLEASDEEHNSRLQEKLSKSNRSGEEVDKLAANSFAEYKINIKVVNEIYKDSIIRVHTAGRENGNIVNELAVAL